MAEKPVATKMRENLDYLRKAGASRARIAQEIDYWKGKMDQQSASERKLSGAEKVAAFGSKMGSGLTFGGLDEALGLFSEDAKNEQRFLQKGLEEESPGVALGAEIGGGLAFPTSFLKAPKVAKAGKAAFAGRAALRAKQAATVLGEGAIQGGLSAVGNAEGGLDERLDDALAGAGSGAATAGFISAGVKMLPALRRGAAKGAGVHAPSLEELVDGVDESVLQQAKYNYGRIGARGLQNEAMMADVLDNGEGLLRSARTANKQVAKGIDTKLRERSTRLSNTADDRLSQHTGTTRQSAKKSVAERVNEARAKAKPEYDKAEAEAASYSLVGSSDFTTPVVLQNKGIQRAVRRVMADDPAVYAGKMEDILADPKLSHRLFDQAYKDIGEEVRYLQEKVRARTASASERRRIKRLDRDRAQLRKAIEVRAPNYPKALDTYAGEIAHKNAYEAGLKNTPADMVADEMAALDPATVPDFKEASVQRFRGGEPNAELGAFAKYRDVLSKIGTREAADQFKARFGERAYKEYLADVMEMAKMQRLKAGAGESTTVDKVIEQLQTGDNPDLVNIVASLASGNVAGGARQFVTKLATGSGLSNLLTSQKNAQALADLMTKSGQDVPRTLDEMIRLKLSRQQPAKPALLRGKYRPTTDFVKNAAAREAGAVTGRERR